MTIFLQVTKRVSKEGWLSYPLSQYYFIFGTFGPQVCLKIQIGTLKTKFSLNLQKKSIYSRWLCACEILHDCFFHTLIQILCWSERRLGSSEKVRHPSLLSYSYWLFCRGRCFSCKPRLWSKLYCFFLRALFHSTLLTMMKTSLSNLLNLWKSSTATLNSGGIRTFRDVGMFSHMIIAALFSLLHWWCWLRVHTVHNAHIVK